MISPTGSLAVTRSRQTSAVRGGATAHPQHRGESPGVKRSVVLTFERPETRLVVAEIPCV